MDKLNALRDRYPWPAEKPNLPFDGHGWFGWCHKAMLDVAFPKDAFVVVEMGSWLGMSTRYLLELAPNATVLAIDHWKGDESIFRDGDDMVKGRLPNLYDQFLANCWEFRDRLIPMRTTTTDGIKEISDLQLLPQFIYLDASHEYKDVKNDLNAIGLYYPTVRLGGDDYGGKWKGVKKAVDEHAAKMGMIVCSSEHAWTMVPPTKLIKTNIAMKFTTEQRKIEQSNKKGER